ncbi:hypothetical protein M8J77_020160 [Diaphorina citri]|nr:hypothetical protein M8J77_020160 [Diaphorina citri]
MYDKIQANQQIPLHDDLLEIPHTRLSSRKPPLSLGKHLRDRNFNMDAEWKDAWIQSQHQSSLFEFAGFNFPRKESSLPRKALCNLNRLRTHHGRCNSCLFKWGLTDDESCECGHPKQTTDHILYDCPSLSFKGNIEDIKTLSSEAVAWLQSLPL